MTAQGGAGSVLTLQCLTTRRKHTATSWGKWGKCACFSQRGEVCTIRHDTSFRHGQQRFNTEPPHCQRLTSLLT